MRFHFSAIGRNLRIDTVAQQANNKKQTDDGCLLGDYNIEKNYIKINHVGLHICYTGDQTSHKIIDILNIHNYHP